MESLYQRAVEKNLVITSSMDELPDEQFVEQAAPRPPGYCAQTVLRFGQLGVTSLLDYGATSSAIPEEVACMLIEYVLAEVAAKRLRVDAPGSKGR